MLRSKHDLSENLENIICQLSLAMKWSQNALSDKCTFEATSVKMLRWKSGLPAKLSNELSVASKDAGIKIWWVSVNLELSDSCQ